MAIKRLGFGFCFWSFTLWLSKSIDQRLGLWTWLLVAPYYDCLSRHALEVHCKGLDFRLSLRRLNTMADLRLQFFKFYCPFSSHPFRISTKFGHSLLRPLDLDSHSIKFSKCTWKWPIIHEIQMTFLHYIEKVDLTEYSLLIQFSKGCSIALLYWCDTSGILVVEHWTDSTTKQFRKTTQAELPYILLRVVLLSTQHTPFENSRAKELHFNYSID